MCQAPQRSNAPPHPWGEGRSLVSGDSGPPIVPVVTLRSLGLEAMAHLPQRSRGPAVRRTPERATVRPRSRVWVIWPRESGAAPAGAADRHGAVGATEVVEARRGTRDEALTQ